MIPITYFFKVIVCSAAFLGYYLIALRNKKFHQYNRFYLLFSVVASWLIPLIKFEINTAQKAQEPIYQAFNYIAESNAAFEFEPNIKIESSFNWLNLIPIVYITIAAIILIVTIISLLKIFKIYRKYPKQKTDNINFINTQEASTPFSFFNNIFWNTNINANTHTGKQILQHELTHVTEKHSWDKIFMQINIVLGWYNPCFWLIKNELEMIHEFIADNKAISNADANEFASMLLLATFPTQQYQLTNPFFFSPIKRRLAMLKLNKNPRLSYLRRLIILPLLAMVVLLFAFRKKENTIVNSIFKSVGIEKEVKNNTTTLQENNSDVKVTMSNIKLSKKYKVVVDAGHGGTDFGATGIDGKTYEKDIALAIAKAIKVQNTNENIEIILSRNDDHFDNLKAKADFSNTQNADLFVSIHCSDAGKNSDANGTEIYVPYPLGNNGFTLASFAFANRINNFLKNNFKTRNARIRKPGVWVLQATKCPSILIETGFVSSKSDLLILTNPAKQNLMALDILKGIEAYLPLLEADKELAPQKQKELNLVDNDSIQIVNLNGDIIETKLEPKASDAAIEEYNNIVKKYLHKSGNRKYDFRSITDEDNNRMLEIFLSMNEEQQNQQKQQTEVFFIELPRTISKAVPTNEQIKEWATNKKYGIWIDAGGQINNAKLLNFSARDFSYYDINKLEKNAMNYGKHYYQINLMTNQLYENNLKSKEGKKYYLVHS